MALNQTARTVLRRVWLGCVANGDAPLMVEDGPATFIDVLIEGMPEENLPRSPLADHYRENRREAEQYLAGLMGMQ